jgi:hypothetical protein
MVEEELSARGVTGSFKLRLGPAVKGTHHVPRFSVGEMTAHNTVEVNIKPGSNNTSHVAWLYPDGKLPQGVTMENLLVALRSEPRQHVPSPGAGFSDDNSNVQGLLRVVASMVGDNYNARLPVTAVKRQLSEVYPHVAEWGLILGTLGRRGLLDIAMTGRRISAVGLTDRGRARLPAGARRPPAPPADANGHGGAAGGLEGLPGPAPAVSGPAPPASPGEVPPAPPPPAGISRAAVADWVGKLEARSEALLVQLEAREKELGEVREALAEAERRKSVARADFAQSSKATDAARALLAALPEEP